MAPAAEPAAGVGAFSILFCRRTAAAALEPVAAASAAAGLAAAFAFAGNGVGALLEPVLSGDAAAAFAFPGPGVARVILERLPSGGVAAGAVRERVAATGALAAAAGPFRAG